MQLPRQTTTFSLRRSLSCYSLVYAFKVLRNLPLISYDDGLIDNGELVVLFDNVLRYSILDAFSSFEVKSEYRSRTALDLQLLYISAAKEDSACCNVLPYLSSLRAPHNHIMFRSPLEIVAFTSG